MRRKSCILCWGLDEKARSEIELKVRQRGLTLVEHTSISDLLNDLASIDHAVGVILGPTSTEGASDEKNDLSSVCKQRGVSICELTQQDTGPVMRDQILEFFTGFLPEKFRDLSLLAVRRISQNLIPDLQLSWEVLGDGTGVQLNDQDFLVHYEMSEEFYSGSVSLSSSYDFIRGQSELMKSMPDEAILQYFGEMGNQILGLIHFNLSQIGVDARIGLPTIVRKEALSSYRRRTPYFMPSITIGDPESRLCVRFDFLVPFLRKAKFDRSLNFEIREASDTEAVTVL